jgi:hypothetical protein
MRCVPCRRTPALADARAQAIRLLTPYLASNQPAHPLVEPSFSAGLVKNLTTFPRDVRKRDTATLIRKIGADSATLLKNARGALPMAAGKYRRVAVVGEDAGPNELSALDAGGSNSFPISNIVRSAARLPPRDALTRSTRAERHALARRRLGLGNSAVHRNAAGGGLRARACGRRADLVHPQRHRVRGREPDGRARGRRARVRERVHDRGARSAEPAARPRRRAPDPDRRGEQQQHGRRHPVRALLSARAPTADPARAARAGSSSSSRGSTTRT